MPDTFFSTCIQKIHNDRLCSDHKTSSGYYKRIQIIQSLFSVQSRSLATEIQSRTSGKPRVIPCLEMGVQLWRTALGSASCPPWAAFHSGGHCSRSRVRLTQREGRVCACACVHVHAGPQMCWGADSRASAWLCSQGPWCTLLRNSV